MSDSISASASMAYVVGHLRVKDAAKWAGYRKRVPAAYQALTPLRQLAADVVLLSCAA